MKVWENQKTIQEFTPASKTRFCWAVCYNCKRRWSETDTEMVHMIYTNKTLYICDDCVDEVKLI